MSVNIQICPLSESEHSLCLGLGESSILSLFSYNTSFERVDEIDAGRLISIVVLYALVPEHLHWLAHAATGTNS